MSISDADYTAWLANDFKQRTVLVEAEYATGTRYISNRAYVSTPTDTPANTPYADLLSGPPEIYSSLEGEFAFARLELHNDSSLDTWLTDPYFGWPLRVYLGDAAWDRDDFRLVLSGINAGISAPSQDRLRFELRDKRELLRVPVQTTLMSSGEPTPLSLGAVFNAEPRLQDAATLRYRYHEDSNATATAVRDNGVAVSFTDQADGSFILAASPAGRITCDVSGDTTGTPAALVEYLALRAPEIAAGDIDSTNLAAFSATYGMALYVRDSADISELIEQVMLSVGGATLFSRLGKLQMVRLETPGTAVLDLAEDDLAERGLSVQDIEQPRAQIQLHYAKNWTVQDAAGLAGAVSAANRDLYSREWSTVTKANTLGSAYPLAESPGPVDTLIVSSVNAQTECDRRATLRGSKRTVYRWQGFAAPFQVQVGQTVGITADRYGFDAGQDAVAIGITQNLIHNRVDLEVWR